MAVVRLAAAAVVGAMVAAIAGGFAAGGFLEEGTVLLGLTWGRVTLVDTYAAFLVGWGWIALRERATVRSSLWLIAVVVTGSLALGVYALAAAVRAPDVTTFLTGPRRGPAEPTA